MTIEESYLGMDPLYERLLKPKFVTSEEAIEFCHQVCLEYGFTVKHEINHKNIYMYCCSREPQQTSRKRPLQSECQWKVVLCQEDETMWQFRKSSDPNASKHNHDLFMHGDEGEDWPQEVVQKIIQLARQKEKDEIREIIKLQFPQITWNDRRFLNYFMEERKRQRQKEITQRVQKLIMSSTKLCSVVAANEDWASCVESDLLKMLNTYRQRTRVSNQLLDNMVDLQMDMIHSEIDTKSSGNTNARKASHVPAVPNHKKRKSPSSSSHHHVDHGVQIMSIPSCTLYIRSQPLRSLSEPSSSSSNNRRALNEMMSSNTTGQQQQLNASFGVNSVFNLTSPISSPSSTSSIQQRIDYGNGFRSNDMLQSPPIPDSSNMMISPNYTASSGNGGGGNNTYNHSMYSFSPYGGQQQQQQQSSSTTTSNSGYNGSGGGGGRGGGGGGGGGGNNNADFHAFEPASAAYGPLGTTSAPAPLMIHNSRSGGNSNMYYTSTPHMGRESSSNSNSIQQRIMMQQQEYDTRHFMESSAVHLPTIRGGEFVQPHHMNPNPQQNWS